MQRNASERAIVLLVAMVQFVNILDFVMVMPMGPDFAVALGIPNSRLGLIGGSYTASAMVSGLVASLFLDRFDRRPALVVSMLGLVVGTAAGGLATGMGSLLAARILAGAFGGPATSVSLSIIADVVPVERRGKALGVVMASFSIASVLGVPAGLELAHRGGWRAPFFAVAALGAILTAVAALKLPSLRGHLTGERPTAAAQRAMTFELLRRPTVLTSYVMSFAAMMGGFVLIPNISPYVQFNLGYPRAHLGRLYFVGGLFSFLTMQVAGRLVDRVGAVRVAAPATVLILFAIAAGFIATPPMLPVIGVFIVFMVSMGFRNVALNTLTSRVPGPPERARFMSIQSAVQHGASSLGAMLSTALLVEAADHTLIGMTRVAVLSMALLATLPFLMLAVERRLSRARPDQTPVPVAETAAAAE